MKVYKCVLPKDINKEKCLHTTIFPFQRIDSKSQNNKDENLFEGHGRSCFREARWNELLQVNAIQHLCHAFQQ